ncbi:hypothetical protein BJ944DRAFT_261366 [Cunninghamella echinulata]|nr:hypothetical protein BJ944DRAFT_261366 [Cunninghamella echinulata]
MKLCIYTICCLFTYQLVVQASQTQLPNVNAKWLEVAERQCGEGYKLVLDNPKKNNKYVEKCLGVSCKDSKGKFKGVVVPDGTPCKFEQTINGSSKIVDGVCQYFLCKANQ